MNAFKGKENILKMKIDCFQQNAKIKMNNLILVYPIFISIILYTFASKLKKLNKQKLFYD